MLLISRVIKFFNLLTSLGLGLLPIKLNSLECMSMNNQKCMSRTKIMNLNPNEPVFFPYSIKINKCSGSCNNINDPFAKLCLPDIIKNINVKVFNIMSRIYETRQIVWHETCKCICRLISAICNNIQTWNKDKCRCECKEDLINKLVCDKGCIWNPSTCECEYDKLCHIGQYLDYKNCICRKSIVDKLVDECVNVVDGDKIYNKTLTATLSNDCSSGAVYIVLFTVFLSISVIMTGVFIYFHWYKNKHLDLRNILNVNYSKT